MTQHNDLYFKSGEEWREWLSMNHAQKEPIWIIYYKKASGKEGISYDESVEQALCFGWIDSTVNPIDDEKYKRKFTRRSNFHNWSPSNRKRVEKLIKTGEMTETGLNTIGNYKESKKLVWPKVELKEIKSFSNELSKILKADKDASSFFNTLTASQQKRYINWVMTAKKEETRTKRMNEALELLRNSTKNLLK